MENKCNKVILCGSKPPQSVLLNAIVDSFDFVVRHNKLHTGMGYGLNPSNLQVVNWHLMHNLKNLSIQQFEKEYSRYNTKQKHISNIYKYFKSNTDKFVTFFENNTMQMRNILEKYKIDIKLTKEIRVGLSIIPLFIEQGIKPFLTGYSLEENTLKNHAVHGNVQLNEIGHSPSLECGLIKALAKEKLVDITFCLVPCNDYSSLSGNEYITEEGIKILKLFRQ